jgi:hypothetical protein
VEAVAVLIISQGPLVELAAVAELGSIIMIQTPREDHNLVLQILAVAVLVKTYSLELQHLEVLELSFFVFQAELWSQLVLVLGLCGHALLPLLTLFTPLLVELERLVGNYGILCILG